jgi:hypothetical protein
MLLVIATTVCWGIETEVFVRLKRSYVNLCMIDFGWAFGLFIS